MATHSTILAWDRGTWWAIVHGVAKTTSATAFTAPLPVDAATKAAHWRVKLSADGRSQELFYNSGITIVFR